MFRLHLEREIAVSHRLEHHNGKCCKLHGHNLNITVDIYVEKLKKEGSSEGMVMDFGDVKRIIDQYDHTHLNNSMEKWGFDYRMQPTAERLAERLSMEIFNADPSLPIRKIVVRVEEAKGQYAEYTLGKE